MTRKMIANLAFDAWMIPQLVFWGIVHVAATAAYVCADAAAKWSAECPDCAELRANREFVLCEACQHDGVM